MGWRKKTGATAFNAAVEGLLGKFKILEWNREAAAVYGKLRLGMQLEGILFSSLDLLIAAQAIAMDGVLVSGDGDRKSVV